ncbi:MAG: DegT/DnrJ/EryC1/StrS family aminotransferase, partial [Verrucomicrobia bacterium]|nr:DegT/DnrJ/EryC1/StrS family aminotransferase [Verrucomicrobiota bacterium]
DDDLACKLRYMKNFGFQDYDKVIHLGVNGKMTEVCAAMGLTGLESLKDFMDVNRRNYEAYRRELKGIPGLGLIAYNDEEECNYQYIIVEVDGDVYGRSRDELIKILHAEGVLARRYFYPGCHRMEPYISLFPHAGLLLPQTKRLAARVLVLPTGTAVSEETVPAIINILRVGSRPMQA